MDVYSFSSLYYAATCTLFKILKLRDPSLVEHAQTDYEVREWKTTWNLIQSCWTFRVVYNGRDSDDVDSKAQDDSAVIIDNQDLLAFLELVKDSCTRSQYVDQ